MLVMTFIDVVAAKRAVFVLSGSQLSAMSTYVAAGPLRKLHAFSNFLALRAPDLNSSQRSKIFVWRSLNFFLWMRRNVFSDTSLTWKDVLRDSR